MCEDSKISRLVKIEPFFAQGDNCSCLILARDRKKNSYNTSNNIYLSPTQPTVDAGQNMLICSSPSVFNLPCSLFDLFLYSMK